MKMALKAKKETPAPPRAEAKAKALKAKKTVLNGVHNHKKEDLHVTHLPKAQTRRLPNILRKAPPGETSMATVPLPSSLDYRVGREEDRRRCHIAHCGCRGQQAPEPTGWEEAP